MDASCQNEHRGSLEIAKWFCLIFFWRSDFLAQDFRKGLQVHLWLNLSSISFSSISDLNGLFQRNYKHHWADFQIHCAPFVKQVANQETMNSWLQLPTELISSRLQIPYRITELVSLPEKLIWIWIRRRTLQAQLPWLPPLHQGTELLPVAHGEWGELGPAAHLSLWLESRGGSLWAKL